MSRRMRLAFEGLRTIEELPPYPSNPKQVQADTFYNYLGLPVFIEVLRHGYRTGVDKFGKRWATKMPAHYGYIAGTTGQDGEDVDIYVNDDPPSVTKPIFQIKQIDPLTHAFDEYKIALGFASDADFRHVYYKVFGDGSGPQRIGAIAMMSLDDFKAWLHDPDHGGVPSVPDEAPEPDHPSLPVTDYPGFPAQESIMRVSLSAPPLTEDENNRDIENQKTVVTETIAVDPAQKGVVVAANPKAKHYTITSLSLPNLGPAPTVTVEDRPDGSFQATVYITSVFSSEKWGFVTDYIIFLFLLAKEGDHVTMAISSPGGEVDLACRLATAMRSTKAKITTVAIGPVASAASMIWAEGQTRFVTPGSYVMTHMSSHGASGHSFNIILEGVNLVKYIRDVVFVRAEQIGLVTPDEITDMTVRGRDLFLSAEEVSRRTGAPILETW